MEFSAGKASLLRELNLLQGVVEKKNVVPALANVLIETREHSRIQLTATDIDVTLITECSADVTNPGSIVIHARKLFDIVRSLPDSDIAFSKDDNEWVRVTCGASHFRMAGIAREHFPPAPQSPGGGILIPAAALHDIISRTSFAITQEESRYALGGALLVLSGNRVLMVATDGHRLAMSGVEVESQLDDVRVIIPKKALGELQRLTAGAEEPVEFSKDENHLFFRVGYRRFTSRVLSGQFPNYEMVIPKDNDKSVVLDSGGLAQTIRRVALMADERSHGVKLHLSDGKLTITSQTADLGEARDVIPVEYEGDPAVIGFNAQYLLEFLGAVGEESVSLRLKDEQSPALLAPADAQQYEYKYVVMPMRL
jgi:DNA polymerase-3 subunit beta